MSEIKERLKHGDVATISSMAQVHYNTAYYTLVTGTRNNKKVKEVAEKYLNMRDAIKNEN